MRCRRGRSAGLALAALTCAAVAGAQAGPVPARASRVDGLRGGSPTGPVKVIALLRDRGVADLSPVRSLLRRRAVVQREQAPVRSTVARLGGRTTHSYVAVNALAATLPRDQVAALAADPAVRTVVPDLDRRLSRVPAAARPGPAAAAPVRALPGTCPARPAAPLLEPEALRLTSTASDDPAVPTARSLGYTGAGVKVAWVADGIDPRQQDFVRADGRRVLVDYQDFSGDGPSAPTSGAEAFGDASAIAAQGRHSYDLSSFVHPAHALPKGCTIRIEGMAPGASLVGLKVFSNDLDTAPTSTIVQALDYAVTVARVDVISESFGANPYPDTAADPISLLNRHAVASGVTVVASSGDAGPANTTGTAATDPWVISAGASTSLRSYAQQAVGGFQLGNGRWVSDQLSALSSGGISQTGRVPDLLAPGDLGWALCSSRRQPDKEPLFDGCANDRGDPSDIQDFGGTSQSAPFTAGAAALVIESYRRAHSGASPAPSLVRRILDSTADDQGLRAEEQGAGRLNSYRAVQLAASTAGGRRQGQELMTDRTQVSVTGSAGRTITRQVLVRNEGVGSQRVTARLRAVGRHTGSTRRTVALDGRRPRRTFVDSFGRRRAYTTVRFAVRPGTDRLAVAVSTPGEQDDLARLSLLDPHRTFTGYSQPQGPGNIGRLVVHQPVPGTWTAVVWTSADSFGYRGPVMLRTDDYRDSAGGTVSPTRFTLAPGAARSVAVRATLPAQRSRAASLVLTGRSGRPSTVPVVLSAVQRVRPRAVTRFSGTFRAGNGREASPAQTDTYRFDVPPGARDLAVGLVFSGTPPNLVAAHLSGPSGEPVATDLNARPAADGITRDRGLQIVHARPAPGRYQLTVELLNPVVGAPLPQTYRGTVTLGAARVSARGLPRNAATRLVRGRPVRGSVTIVNTSRQPLTYYLDARTTSLATYRLVPIGPSDSPGRVALPLTSDDVPAWVVPTRVRRLTVGASATVPVAFDVMALDNPTAFNAPSTPDVEAVSSGKRATAVHSAREVTPSVWAAFPSLVGPTSGRARGSVSMTARVVAEGFANDIRSAVGDPLLATIGRSAPEPSLLSLPPGDRSTVHFTLTPRAARGRVVRGTLYVNTLSPFGLFGLSGLGDEVAALPYAYRVG